MNELQKLIARLFEQHEQLVEAINSLHDRLAEVASVAERADQNVHALARNVEANLGVLDQQIRNQGEAIVGLTRGVVETFSPRQVTTPGASKRRAKIASRRSASASRAVVDATPGHVDSDGEPVVQKAMEAWYRG
jgi:ABC-type transporter Mla subunit MlaD